jgi:hypothetical protein
MTHVATRVDSVDRSLRRVRSLSAEEQGALRRDVNATQVARARQLGIPRGADVQGLLASGRLVELEESNDYWVLRDLTHSKPYVTPETHALLMELGRRFHAELDRHGLPRFRYQITSVLRTPEHQSALQRSNSNAASGVSAHEFGTTIDIAYRRFSAPGAVDLGFAESYDPVAEERLHLLHDVLIEETARERGAELQAILGRAIRELRDEGRVLVMMERRQTVYHMTVARR